MQVEYGTILLKKSTILMEKVNRKAYKEDKGLL